LPAAAKNSSSAIAVAARPCLAQHRQRLRVHLAKRERAKQREHQKHRQQVARVADAVHNKRLVRRVRVRFPLRVAIEKANQQITAQSNPLPADEHHQKVARQHQRQHKKDEQIEVGEKAWVVFVLRHVTRGV
jgi:hypothetical protein